MFGLKELILRIIAFLVFLVLTVFLGWWFFVPLFLLYALFVFRPYEFVFLAALLDQLYYFGSGFWLDHILLLVSLLALFTALLIEDRVSWRKLL